jgi:hypothetical protein
VSAPQELSAGNQAYDTDQDQVSIPQPRLRYMPPPPMGSGVKVDAFDLLRMGAEAGARGIEGGKVTELAHTMQSGMVSAVVAMMPDVLKVVKEVSDARLNRILQAVDKLTSVPVQQFAPQAPDNRGLVDRMMNIQPPQLSQQQMLIQQLDVVHRSEVINIIATALATPPGN